MGLSWRRIGLVLAGLGLAGSIGALVAADLLPLWWWSEMWQHPRPQLAAGSLLCALIWSLLARLRWRWFALLVPLWAVAGMLPALAGRQAQGQVVCSLVSANVHSTNPDPAGAVAQLLALDADILVLLEPDHGWAKHLQPLREAYPLHREMLRDDNFGICAYTRRGVIAVWEPEAVEVPGLLVGFDGIEVLAVHPPPPFSAEYHRWWSAQLTAIAAWAAAHPQAVVAGDLNATPWCSGFRRLCREGRLAGPGGLAAWTPTWLSGTPLAASIDHVLVGPGLGLAGQAIGPDIGSDHRPVRVHVVRP